MNAPRERSAIVAAWLEEGPNELPDFTRRAIAVDIRTTRQSRRSIWRPWRFLALDRASLIAVAVLALALTGLTVFVVGPFGGRNVGGSPSSAPSASPSPSPSPAPVSPSPPAPTTVPIPAMTQTYVSERHGYSISYPADWNTFSATDPWSPPAWKAGGEGEAPFDFLEAPEPSPWFRAASAALPEGLPSVNDWIDEYLTFSSVPGCAPPRETWELVLIDGAPGRLRDSCGEVEATVVLEGRVYMFTLFLGEVTNGRELFDAFAATIDLRPEDATLPSPSP